MCAQRRGEVLSGAAGDQTGRGEVGVVGEAKPYPAERPDVARDVDVLAAKQRQPFVLREEHADGLRDPVPHAVDLVRHAVPREDLRRVERGVSDRHLLLSPRERERQSPDARQGRIRGVVCEFVRHGSVLHLGGLTRSRAAPRARS